MRALRSGTLRVRKQKVLRLAGDICSGAGGRNAYTCGRSHTGNNAHTRSYAGSNTDTYTRTDAYADTDASSYADADTRADTNTHPGEYPRRDQEPD